jgi:hypothetical protein
MKNLTLIVGGIALALNLLFGVLLSGYSWFNVGFTSIVIILTTLLIYLLRVLPMKDGFVIGLSFFFLLMGIVELILGFVSRPTVTDNGFVIATVLMLAFEAVLLIICSSISKKVK